MLSKLRQIQLATASCLVTNSASLHKQPILREPPTRRAPGRLVRRLCTGRPHGCPQLDLAHQQVPSGTQVAQVGAPADLRPPRGAGCAAVHGAAIARPPCSMLARRLAADAGAGRLLRPEQPAAWAAVVLLRQLQRRRRLAAAGRVILIRGPASWPPTRRPGLRGLLPWQSGHRVDQAGRRPPIQHSACSWARGQPRCATAAAAKLLLLAEQPLDLRHHLLMLGVHRALLRQRGLIQLLVLAARCGDERAGW